MPTQPTSPPRAAAATPAQLAAVDPAPEAPPGYEILVCRACQHHNAPRPTTRHQTVPCISCAANDFARLAVVALEPAELALLTGLAELLLEQLPRDVDHKLAAAVLDKLHAEQRFEAL